MTAFIRNFLIWIVFPIAFWTMCIHYARADQGVCIVTSFDYTKGEPVYSCIDSPSLALKDGAILELSDSLIIKPSVMPGKLKGWMLIRIGKFDTNKGSLAFIPVFEVPTEPTPSGNPWWNCSIYSELPCD